MNFLIGVVVGLLLGLAIHLFCVRKICASLSNAVYENIRVCDSVRAELNSLENSFSSMGRRSNRTMLG